MTKETPAEAALAYIKYVLGQTNLSPTALAVKAGIASSTLTRPLNNKLHKFSPSLVTLEKIERASGIKFQRFLAAGDVFKINMVPYTDDIYDKSWGEEANFDDLSEFDALGYGIIIGKAAAGEWRDFEIEKGNAYTALPRSMKPSEAFGLFASGTSTNLISNDGQVFICKYRDAVEREAFERRAKYHEHHLSKMYFPYSVKTALVIERRTDDKSLVELSVRFPIWNGEQWMFVCPSSEAHHRKPIIRDNLSSDEHFIILGEVREISGLAILDDALMHKMGLTP